MGSSWSSSSEEKPVELHSGPYWIQIAPSQLRSRLPGFAGPASRKGPFEAPLSPQAKQELLLRLSPDKDSVRLEHFTSKDLVVLYEWRSPLEGLEEATVAALVGQQEESHREHLLLSSILFCGDRILDEQDELCPVHRALLWAVAWELVDSGVFMSERYKFSGKLLAHLQALRDQRGESKKLDDDLARMASRHRWRMTVDWTPETHHLYPKEFRKVVPLVLWIVKPYGIPKDVLILIFRLIAPERWKERILLWQV